MTTKPIRMKLEKWEEVKELADTLSAELNMNVSLPDAISHAVSFYNHHRNNPYIVRGKPGGSK